MLKKWKINIPVAVADAFAGENLCENFSLVNIQENSDSTDKYPEKRKIMKEF